VLERSNLGPLLNEFTLAYNLGDPQAARKFLGMGKLKSTKYVIKFDILKTEQIAAAQSGFDGRAIGDMAALAGVFSGSWRGAQAGTVAGRGIGSVQSNEATSVWIIGMRYKVINAETTEQVAQAEIEATMRNDPDAALSASKRLGASFLLRGLIRSQATRNPVMAVNQVSVTMGFTLAGSDGRQVATAEARSQSYAGADVGRMALTLVEEEADAVVASLYADYCRNAGFGAPARSAPKKP
jgi:hypothetical protein